MLASMATLAVVEAVTAVEASNPDSRGVDFTPLPNKPRRHRGSPALVMRSASSTRGYSALFGSTSTRAQSRSRRPYRRIHGFEIHVEYTFYRANRITS